MNVVLVSNLYPPEVIGGAEKHVEDDARKLVERGHEVSVVTTAAQGSVRSIERERVDGVDVYRFRPLNMYTPYEYRDVSLWKKPIQHGVNLWNPHPYRMVGKLFGDLDPDVIHVHNYGGLSKSVFSAAGRSDAPVVHTLHDYRALHLIPNLFVDGEIAEPGPAMKAYQTYNDWILGRNVDLVLSPSQFVIDKHRSEGLFGDTPTRRLLLGVEPQSESDRPSASDEDEDGCRLLFAGQLTYAKGLDVLADAVKRVDDDALGLHVLGKGPEKEAIERAAEEDDRIHVHGFVPEAELERQYELADFTVVPSRWYDNSPMVIYESYLRDTPVVGADIGGIPELVDEGETGFLFEPEDPAALAATIEEHGAESDELASHVADVDVSLDTHVTDLCEIYEELI